MDGRVIRVWADIALTEIDGDYHLWESDGHNYGKHLPFSFPDEESASEYAKRFSPKTSKRDQLIYILLMEGEDIIREMSTYQTVCLTRFNGGHYWLGQTGNLRVGTTREDSMRLPALEDELLANGPRESDKHRLTAEQITRRGLRLV